MLKKIIKGILTLSLTGCILGVGLGNTYTPVNGVEQGDLDDAKDAIAEKEEEIDSFKRHLMRCLLILQVLSLISHSSTR